MDTVPLEALNCNRIFILTESKKISRKFIQTFTGKCCVDETASAHITADSIIHFGPACLSKTSRLPVYYVFPRYTLNVDSFAEQFRSHFADKDEKLALFYDAGYSYDLPAIKDALGHCYTDLMFGKLALQNEVSTLGWQQLPTNRTCVYVGADNQTFFVLSLTVHADRWFLYNPQADATAFKQVTPLTTTWMRRRYYAIEKCKDAQSLGIVVSTLTANGYLDAVQHVQTLAKKRGIRTYMISVGKVNPAKLANFMDIDCFVIVGCPMNDIYTSREFYKPLLSVFEVEMALNPAWHETVPQSYAVDFREILPGGRLYRQWDDDKVVESDVSLITGAVRLGRMTTAIVDETPDGRVQERRNHELLLSGSAGNSYLNRSWTGLDPALGQTEPARMQQGRSGIAIKYEDDRKIELKED